MIISIILPCLNEEKAISQSIKKIQTVLNDNNLNSEIIVVDNGSTDRSSKIIRQHQVKYIFEPKRGYGHAYRTGFKYARGDYLILVDPDNSYDMSEIPNFLKKLKTADFVIGSRYLGQMEKGAMPWSHKYIGNPIIRLFLRFNGIKTKETSTGFVGFKKNILKKINLKQTGMEFSSELLVKVNKNFTIKEIPINYHCRLGQSKIKGLTDGFRHLNFLIKAKIKPDAI